MTRFFSSTFWALFVIFIFVFEKYENSFSWGLPFDPFWSARYPNFGGESYEIRILFRSIQETYTLRKEKKLVLLFRSSWEPQFSDLMIYCLILCFTVFCLSAILNCFRFFHQVTPWNFGPIGSFYQTLSYVLKVLNVLLSFLFYFLIKCIHTFFHAK